MTTFHRAKKSFTLFTVFLLIATILLAYFVSVPMVSADDTWWTDNAWDYCKTITVNSSQVDSTLTNFPILVSISGDTDLGSHAQTDGDDLLFTLDNLSLIHI